MKAAIWKSVNNIEVEEIGIPKTSEGEVLVKVAYAGICGSDITVLSGKHINAKPPVVLGHEFSGVIEDSKSKYFKKGDRVAVEPLVSCGYCKPCSEGNNHVCANLKLLGINEDGAFAEYAKAHESKTFKIPDNMHLMEAAMLEPFSVAMHGMDASNMKIGKHVLVVGAGPVGIMAAMLAGYFGAGKVIVSELTEFRIDFAEKLGFETFNPSGDGDLVEHILKHTDGNGADIAFECGGTPESVKSCLDCIGIKGRVVQIGIPKVQIETDYRRMVYKEQEIMGIRIYQKGTFGRAIRFLSDRNINLKGLVSDIFSLEDITKAIERANDKNKSLKVLIKF